jgi:glycosyltransferase involved in cell wall biosynthesis
MRILMVTSFFPHAGAGGGGATVMHGQLLALAARHRVTLVSLAETGAAEAGPVRALRDAGVEVHVVPRPTAGPAAAARRAELAARWVAGGHPLRALAFARPAVQALLDRLLAGGRFDLVQVEDSAMGAYAYRTAAPKVLTDHEVRAPSEEDGAGGGVLRHVRDAERRRWASFQPEVWRRFDRVQVFTRRDADAVRALAPDVASRVRVNPFGVDLPEAAAPEREVPGSVVFVGGFRHPPNVDAALWLVRDVLPRLRELRPGVRLTLVGSDPPPRVRALAAADVEVTGRVDAVEPYLERAALVVAPLRTGGGMRVKVLQAMAMGKAVVSTPLGAEGLAEAGGPPPLALAADAEGIAAAAAELLRAPDARRALGRRARAFVAAHHGWGAYADRLEATYAELGAGEVAAC